jgi:hypothetical protein
VVKWNWGRNARNKGRKPPKGTYDSLREASHGNLLEIPFHNLLQKVEVRLLYYLWKITEGLNSEESVYYRF